MIQKLYHKDFNHIRFGKQFRLLLKLCMAKETSRYAINGVNIAKDGFTATNGKIMFNLADNKHGMESGVYHLTAEGFGLFEIEGNFPKWGEIIPKKTDIKEVYSTNYLDKHTRQLVIYHLNRNDVNFRIDWLMQVLQRLELLHARDLEVSVHKKDPAKMPPLITGTIQDNKFTYVQMPIKA